MSCQCVECVGYIPEPTDWEIFASALASKLTPFLRMPIKPITLDMVNTQIAYLFYCAEAERLLLTPMDGIRITGGKVWVKDYILQVQWMTEFFPDPRWGGQEGKVIPLGFFDSYDLYVGLQDPLPFTLIVRFGNRPWDYHTWNPNLSSEPPTHPALLEAYRRAKFINPEKK